MYERPAGTLRERWFPPGNHFPCSTISLFAKFATSLSVIIVPDYICNGIKSACTVTNHRWLSIGAPVIVAVALVQLLQHRVSALRRTRKKVSVAAVSGCLLRMDPPGLCGCCDGVICLYAVSWPVWLLLWSYLSVRGVLACVVVVMELSVCTRCPGLCGCCYGVICLYAVSWPVWLL